jgi:hypothetical protein
MEGVKEPENIERGVSWACAVEDLARAVPEVPEFPPMDILM